MLMQFVVTQTREDSGPDTDDNLNHEFVVTGPPIEGPLKAEIPKFNDSTNALP